MIIIEQYRKEGKRSAIAQHPLTNVYAVPEQLLFPYPLPTSH